MSENDKYIRAKGFTIFELLLLLAVLTWPISVYFNDVRERQEAE